MRTLKQHEIELWAKGQQQSARRRMAEMHPSNHPDFVERCILEFTLLLKEVEGEFPEPFEEPDHAQAG